MGLMGKNVMFTLRDRVTGEVFDAGLLLEMLSDYAKPRNRITRLIEEGEIVRIRRGLYIFGKHWRRGPIHRELLANLIYGPSYVSTYSALAFYGKIPERVESVTSTCMKRSKSFETPLGLFAYTSLSKTKYATGVDRLELTPGQFCLIASPEKALADLVAPIRDISTPEEMDIYLREDLRLDSVEALNQTRLHEIAKVYGNQRVDLLLEVT
jgi:phage terminase large subunit-like protein